MGGFDLGGTFGSWEPQGPRIVVVESNDGVDKVVFLDEKKGLLGTPSPDFGGKAFRLGNVVWSRDGKTLYASSCTKGEQENSSDYWLAEIPVAGAPSRLTRIAHINALSIDHLEDDLIFSMRVSLSPDGNLIAATPANLGKDNIAEADRALFLIDVQHPAHRITRIPIPE